MTTQNPLLEFDAVSVDYGSRRRRFTAAESVSFAVLPGQTVGLVGESGSGKTTVGSTAVGLNRVAGGSIRYDGVDVTHISRSRRRELGAEIQMVFQDPYSSLNPLRTIEQTLVEPLLVHTDQTAREARATVGDMLERVGMPRDAAKRYPGAFSGGQRQRIAIARALVVSPRIVVCDEAVSALDLSIQAQVLNLLLTLQKEFDVSYLFISHDLSVTRHMCDQVVVLYRGRVVEIGDSLTVHDRPAHPYTQALVSASPIPEPEKQRSQRESIRLLRAPSRPDAGSAGCRFASRCPLATEFCEKERPELTRGSSGALVACHHAEEAAQMYESTRHTAPRERTAQ